MAELEKDLKRWGAAVDAAVDDDQTAFAEAVVNRVRDLPASGRVEEGGANWWPWTLAFAAAAVAAIIFWPGHDGRPVPPADAVVYDGLSTTDLAELRTIADEVQTLFPDGVRWVGKVNGELVLAPGASRQVEAVGDAAPRILVALAVMVRGADGVWRQQARHDVVTHAGEPVEMNGTGETVLWSHMVDENRASVEASLELVVAGKKLAVSGSDVRIFGQPALLYESANHAGKAIRIYQTVYRI